LFLEIQAVFYKNLQALSPEQFKRLTGVKLTTFTTMIDVLQQAKKPQKYKGGGKNKLCIEDRLLMTLSYLREYRTQFHIAQDFKVSESTCSRTIVWVENTLIGCGLFSLPKRQSWQGEETDIEVVYVDATETPIERPKKNRNATIQARKNDTP
jgi:transcriptional antiterminator